MFNADQIATIASVAVNDTDANATKTTKSAKATSTNPAAKDKSAVKDKTTKPVKATADKTVKAAKPTNAVECNIPGTNMDATEWLNPELNTIFGARLLGKIKNRAEAVKINLDKAYVAVRETANLTAAFGDIQPPTRDVVLHEDWCVTFQSAEGMARVNYINHSGQRVTALISESILELTGKLDNANVIVDNAE
jgi:hypothetical protein